MEQYKIYVNRDIAIKAMSKGFDDFIFIGKHLPDDYEKCFCDVEDDEKGDYWYLPTAEEICSWLRKKKNIFVMPFAEKICDSYGNVKEINFDIEIIKFDSENEETQTLYPLKYNELKNDYGEIILFGINYALDLI